MTWEIQRVLKDKKNKIKKPKFPSTLREDTEYKPFYYIEEPKCVNGSFVFEENPTPS